MRKREDQEGREDGEGEEERRVLNFELRVL